MKEQIKQAIDVLNEDLIKLSHDIHENPELGFEEEKAAKWQVELLKKHGFEVEYPYCNLKTAFRATFKGKAEGPKVAMLSEYDALKGAGHACGHNIIASSAVGAAIGLSKVMSTVNGEVVVIGTPAEEGGGGKVLMIDQGAFEDIHYAMMMHPSNRNIIGRGGLACVTFSVEFFGKAAHSASPEKGINALSSVIGLFNNIDVLRQSWKLAEDPKINGMISSGGKASNIIAEYAAANFTVRAKTRKYLLKMIEDLKRVSEAAALMTGATVKYSTDLIYAERYPNLAMGETFKANMAPLGEVMGYPSPTESVGSSDIGNVSLEVPAIHEYLWIANETVNSHSDGFRNASKSKRGDEVVILGAKGLALTAYDILTDEKLRAKINEEFKNTVLVNK